jgi:hypothetical protein
MQPQLPLGGVSTLVVTLPPDHVPSSVAVSSAVARFGSAGATQTLTVRNTGDTLAHIGRVRLAGGDARHFKVAADRCSRHALMPGDRCRVKVRYRPRSADTHTARLVVRHDGRGGQRVVRLRGAKT